MKRFLCVENNVYLEKNAFWILNPMPYSSWDDFLSETFPALLV